MRATDCIQLYVVGINPHDYAVQLHDISSPFYDVHSYPSVIKTVTIDNVVIAGIIEVWVHEHMTSAQQKFLREDIHILAVHHVFPR